MTEVCKKLLALRDEKSPKVKALLWKRIHSSPQALQCPLFFFFSYIPKHLVNSFAVQSKAEQTLLRLKAPSVELTSKTSSSLNRLATN